LLSADSIAYKSIAIINESDCFLFISWLEFEKGLSEHVFLWHWEVFLISNGLHGEELVGVGDSMSATGGWEDTTWEWLVRKLQCLKIFFGESSKIIVENFLTSGKVWVICFFASSIAWNLECIKLISKDEEWGLHVVEAVLTEDASRLFSLWLSISAIFWNDSLSRNLKILKEHIVCWIKWANRIWVQRHKVHVKWWIMDTKDIEAHTFKKLSNLIKMDHATNTTCWVASKDNSITFVLAKSLMINEVL